MSKHSSLLTVLLTIMTLVGYAEISYAKELTNIPTYITEYIKNDNLTIGKKYYTSFETVKEFSKFYIVPQNHKKSTSHDLTTETKVSGNKSHKSWVYKQNKIKSGENTNHRGYPTFQLSKTSLGVIKTAAIVDFWVNVDVPLKKKNGESWVSLATLGSYSDNTWPRVYLINLDSQYRLHLMHIPNQSENLSDIYQAKSLILPRKKWVRVTAYIDYTDSNRFDDPFIAIWQDGVLAGAAHLNDRINPHSSPSSHWPKCLKNWDRKSMTQAEKLCKLSYEGGLSQAHFGMYAPPYVSSGTIYNDDLTILEILKDGQQSYFISQDSEKTSEHVDVSKRGHNKN